MTKKRSLGEQVKIDIFKNGVWKRIFLDLRPNKKQQFQRILPETSPNKKQQSQNILPETIPNKKQQFQSNILENSTEINTQ